MDATIYVYVWCCHAKCLVTLQDVRCNQVNTTLSVGFQKRSCRYLPLKIIISITWSWLCWTSNSCHFNKACKSTWTSSLGWARTLSSKQPDTKKICLLWNEGQVLLWKEQCRTSYWLFFCISQQTVMCLHIDKSLCTCFMYITRSKTNKKSLVIVHWMCYVAFPFPTKKIAKNKIKTPSYSCLVPHIWDAIFFVILDRNSCFGQND